MFSEIHLTHEQIHEHDIDDMNLNNRDAAAVANACAVAVPQG